MDLMKFFSRYKKVTLSPFEKVSHAQNKVGHALSMFSKANEEIDIANSMLEEAKTESQKEKDSLLAKLNNIDNNITKADDEIFANVALKKEFSKFIK